jgi:hypothetical protein
MMQFREGEPVWLMIDGAWQRGEVRTADEQSVQVRVSFGTEWRGAPYLTAESALGFAVEAVAKARDEVVARSEAWYEAKHTIAAGSTAGALEDAVAALRDAERAEAEARARLEALR